MYAQDILSSLGFLRHVFAAMNLKPGGVLWAGVVCSTWSVVNRGTSGRTKDEPLGREQLGYIALYTYIIFVHISRYIYIYNVAFFRDISSSSCMLYPLLSYRSPSLQWAQVLQECETRQPHASS